MKRTVWFIIPVFILLSAFSPMLLEEKQSGDDENQIMWLSLDEAVAANKENPKMIFIDFYTDWCGWCKNMDANTFSNPQIAKLMNDNFYAVKFNAEMKDPVTFQGVEYTFNTGVSRPAHNFAIETATYKDRLGYPSFVVMDENFEKLKLFQGFKTVDALKEILEYYGDKEIYTKINWLQFIQGGSSAVD